MRNRSGGHSAQEQTTRRRMQWRLSTIFVVTTIAAIAFAGFARLGLVGALAFLGAAWHVMLGVFCIAAAFAQRRDRWLPAAIGLVFIAIGLALAARVYSLHDLPAGAPASSPKMPSG
jgi:hypothetical protein